MENPNTSVYGTSPYSHNSPLPDWKVPNAYPVACIGGALITALLAGGVTFTVIRRYSVGLVLWKNLSLSASAVLAGGVVGGCLGHAIFWHLWATPSLRARKAFEERKQELVNLQGHIDAVIRELDRDYTILNKRAEKAYKDGNTLDQKKQECLDSEQFYAQCKHQNQRYQQMIFEREQVGRIRYLLKEQFHSITSLIPLSEQQQIPSSEGEIFPVPSQSTHPHPISICFKRTLHSPALLWNIGGGALGAIALGTTLWVVGRRYEIFTGMPQRLAVASVTASLVGMVIGNRIGYLFFWHVKATPGQRAARKASDLWIERESLRDRIRSDYANIDRWKRCIDKQINSCSTKKSHSQERSQPSICSASPPSDKLTKLEAEKQSLIRIQEAMDRSIRHVVLG